MPFHVRGRRKGSGRGRSRGRMVRPAKCAPYREAHSVRHDLFRKHLQAKKKKKSEHPEFRIQKMSTVAVLSASKQCPT